MSKTENAATVSLDPPLAYPDYRSSILRAPSLRPIVLEPGRAELSGPVFGDSSVHPLESDLTRQTDRAPIGERIVVEGRVVDRDGRPVAGTLVEVWHANAAGRYAHPVDVHPAPLDPGFVGAGRCLTDAEGNYRFVTIKPGAYPWGNHHNAWRPAHIHFSLFGRAFTQRLITQMYFPGDPLMEHDPIFQSVPLAGRPLLVAAFDLDVTKPDWALGFRWDIVLGGHAPTPLEN